MLKQNKILGIKITNETEDNILKYILQCLENNKKTLFIITPNPEIIVYANKHKDYKGKLNSAEIALPDGVGVFLASLLSSNPLKERIPGVDFMEEICKKCVKKPLSMGFLGGRDGVAQGTAECLKEKYPWIDVVFADSDPKKLLALPKSVTHWKMDILFVALGHPKQEEWIYEHLNNLPAKAAMGVGGAFDYLSGNVIRAPYVIRAMGLEWLFRLIKQPWRFKRQLALAEFVFLVLQEFANTKLRNRPASSEVRRRKTD